MHQSDSQIHARAAALAEELTAGVQHGRPAEWVEEVLGSALLELARQERERCARLAERPVELWETTARRMASGPWPAAALREARERHKEARVIADALRAETAVPLDG